MEMEPSGSLETMAEECFRELPSRSLYLPAPIPSSPSPWTTLSPRAFKWLEELYKTGWNNSPLRPGRTSFPRVIPITPAKFSRSKSFKEPVYKTILFSLWKGIASPSSSKGKDSHFPTTHDVRDVTVATS